MEVFSLRCTQGKAVHGHSGKVRATRCRHGRCPRHTLRAGGRGGLPFEGPTRILTLGCSGLALDSAVTQFKMP